MYHWYMHERYYFDMCKGEEDREVVCKFTGKVYRCKCECHEGSKDTRTNGKLLDR